MVIKGRYKEGRLWKRRLGLKNWRKCWNTFVWWWTPWSNAGIAKGFRSVNYIMWMTARQSGFAVNVHQRSRRPDLPNNPCDNRVSAGEYMCVTYKHLPFRLAKLLTPLEIWCLWASAVPFAERISNGVDFSWQRWYHYFYLVCKPPKIFEIKRISISYGQ